MLVLNFIIMALVSGPLASLLLSNKGHIGLGLFGFLSADGQLTGSKGILTDLYCQVFLLIPAAKRGIGAP